MTHSATNLDVEELGKEVNFQRKINCLVYVVHRIRLVNQARIVRVLEKDCVI